MRDIDELLKENLTPDFTPADDLNMSIMQEARREKVMKKKTFKSTMAAAIAVAVILLGSVSGYAAYRLLSPADVANEMAQKMDDKEIAENFGAISEAFNSEDAVIINETKKYGDYSVTLLGIVSGEDLNCYEGIDGYALDNIEREKTYVVMASENTSETGNSELFVEAYVKGYDKLRFDMGCRFAYEKDGVKYYISSFYELEKCTGIGVSLGVKEMVDGQVDSDTDAQLVFDIPRLKGADDASADSIVKKMLIEKEDEQVMFNTVSNDVDPETGLPLLEKSQASFESLGNKKMDMLRRVCYRDLTLEQKEALISHGTEIASQDLLLVNNEAKINFEYAEGEIWNCILSVGSDSDIKITFFSRNVNGDLLLKAVVNENGSLKAKVYSYSLEQVEKLIEDLRS